MKFGRDEVLMARICVKAFYQIHPGVDPRQGKKSKSFKDKRLYLECCHSGRGFGQIFQGVDPRWGKNR